MVRWRALMVVFSAGACTPLAGAGGNSCADVMEKAVIQVRPTPTAEQIEGPFYPGRELFRHKTSDLTRGGQAAGQLLRLKGTLRDQRGRPVRAAEIEIWQDDGRSPEASTYDHPRAKKPQGLDPGFEYFGRAKTGVDGAFEFHTVVPFEYLVPPELSPVPGWTRPKHIHVKVRDAEGREILTTQLYIPTPKNGESKFYLARDLFFQELSAAQKQTLVLDVREESDATMDRKVLIAEKDIWIHMD